MYYMLYLNRYYQYCIILVKQCAEQRKQRMSYKTFFFFLPDESRIISCNYYILSLDTYIYQGHDKLQDKNAKETEASEANLISSNRILNLSCVTDSLYPSKDDNQ